MKSVLLCVAALAFLGGCSKNIDTTDAVKRGIVDDIRKKVDVDHMDVNVDSVSFRDKEASANVSFWPKGGDRSQSITMTYQLERVGDEWHVKSRDMMRHDQSTPPNGGQVAGGQSSGEANGQQLPPGHPSVQGSGDGQQLPPGHPPIGGGANPAVHQ